MSNLESRLKIYEKRDNLASVVRELVTVSILLSSVTVILFKYLLSKDQKDAFGGLFLLFVQSIPFVHIFSFIFSVSSLYFLLNTRINERNIKTAIGLIIVSLIFFLSIFAIMIYISFAVPISGTYVVIFLIAVTVLIVQTASIVYLFSIRKLFKSTSPNLE